ncbi:MAG: hypothetical protein HQ564_05715 [Candidatus Saganbacteria bacterium]|nr:hypothetical protein [Candidatus Saganbacteria bacterium]
MTKRSAVSKIVFIFILVALAAGFFMFGKLLAPYWGGAKRVEKQMVLEQKIEEPTSSFVLDWDLLIKALETGKTQKTDVALSIIMKGVKAFGKGFFIVKKVGPDKCKLYIEITQMKVEYSEEMKKRMLAKGITKDEIAKEEKKAAAIALKGVRKRTHIFKKNVLLGLLKNWKAGKFSSDDFKLAEKPVKGKK